MATLESAAVEAAASCPTDTKQTVKMASSSVETSQLGLIPLRSPSKRKNLEMKKLPIVLGRTNLSQWWYQSCDCQHYYCRIHCRPVAQNIGSLSKVMIQIDSSCKVFVVGKNPHLVTITPERLDGILKVNDILSIGRKDREPWMKFQVVENVNGHFDVPVVTSTRSNGKRSSIISGQNEPQGLNPKKSKLLFRSPSSNPTTNNGSVNNRTNNNLSSDVSRNVPTEGQQRQQDQQQKEQHPKDEVGVPVFNEYPGVPPNSNAPASQKDPSKGSNRNLRNFSSNQYDGQLPEWITTTTTKRNKGTRSTSSLSVAPHGTSTKQQQHQDMVARLSMAAAAANAGSAPGVTSLHPTAAPAAGTASRKRHNYHCHLESDPNAFRKHRRRTMGSFGRDSNVMNGSSRGIRSAEDLFNGAPSQSPQIHIMFQDYETSAKLVMTTQRDRVDQRPRTDRNFIGKPGLGSPTNDCMGDPLASSCAVAEQTGEGAPEQLELMSKKFAAALLDAAAPSSGPFDSHKDDHVQPVVVAEERLGQNRNAEEQRHASQHDRDMTKSTFTAPKEEQDLGLSSARKRDNHSPPRMMSRSNSATCTAPQVQYTTKMETAARRKSGSMQAEGEKTSELED